MHPKGMKVGLILSVACTLVLSGCFDSNNTRSLQQHTADATAAAKRDAGAVARGVVEGLTRRGPTDINTASARDLEKLPDVTAAEVQAIIAGRPYENTSQLVGRHILSKAEYKRIRTQIGVK
jgi:DNA uptake protein ComE-like DNA-binding protein